MIIKINYLETEDEKYPIAFTLNFIESIQEKYGTDKWAKLVKNTSKLNIKAIKVALTETINECLNMENEKMNEKRKPISTKKSDFRLQPIKS